MSVTRWSDTGSSDDALGRVRAGARRIWPMVAYTTADQRTRWLRWLARLGVSVRTPVYGLVVAEFPAGRQ
jgi:hypothetical protein